MKKLLLTTTLLSFGLAASEKDAKERPKLRTTTTYDHNHVQKRIKQLMDEGEGFVVAEVIARGEETRRILAISRRVNDNKVSKKD